ncbi:MAG: ATP-binding protein [Alphaproteobacteria bacterium]|nr:ATP-binding protein [Alphaproteobacteria bacterium]
MKKRNSYLNLIKDRFLVNPAVALLGPRQSGKTTLARFFSQQMDESVEVHWFDLDDTGDLSALQNPKTVLESLTGLIIIDEVQKLPALFPILRVLLDQHVEGRQFLLLGSASKDLIEQSSETLAGRLSYIEVSPFSIVEVDDVKKLWHRGGYPRSYLANSNAIALQWVKDYTAAFLERDLPMLGIKVSPEAMRRFWMMLTHSHGSVSNLSDIGRSLGISHTTARHYLDILSSSFMIRQLQPWFANISKRQVKSPKIYFKDSGIYHYLLGLSFGEDILHHPKLGASWEGFALEQIIKYTNADAQDCYFWGIHAQNELDLLIVKEGQKQGFEFKFSDKVTITKSMKESLETLDLDHLTVIFPGKKTYKLDEKITAKGLESLVKNDSKHLLNEE